MANETMKKVKDNVRKGMAEVGKTAAHLKADAKAGGNIAGGARKKLERRLGRSIVTKNNFLKNEENKKLA